MPIDQVDISERPGGMDVFWGGCVVDVAYPGHQGFSERELFNGLTV